MSNCLDDDEDDDEEQRLKRVGKWLDSSASGDWIMIVDNFDAVDPYLAKYLPVQRGAILYTTRDRRLVGNRAYVPPGTGVGIYAMSDKEALEMFAKILAIDPPAAPIAEPAVPTCDGHALELLNRLEKLPLAIEQAAAYIQQTGDEIPMYLKMFDECELNQQGLLNEALPAVNEDSKRHDSRAVMTTWKLTISKLQEKNPESVQLLQVMSFLNPDDIPKDLLNGIPFLKNANEVAFSKAFAPLLCFSLIYQLESSNFRLHRLVGLCIRRQMDSENIQRRNELLETVFRLLNDSVPEDMAGNHFQCLHIAVHAATALGNKTNVSHPGAAGLAL